MGFKKDEQNVLVKIQSFGNINLNLYIEISQWHYSEDERMAKKK